MPMLKKRPGKSLQSSRSRFRNTDLKGTRGYSDLYLRIWNVVERIPYGRTSTYGAIAKTAGFQRRARLVGYALHNLPPGSDIPWHRVINSRGKISLPGDTGRAQASLLNKEGIVLSAGKVNLQKFGWPRSAFKKSY